MWQSGRKRRNAGVTEGKKRGEVEKRSVRVGQWAKGSKGGEKKEEEGEEWQKLKERVMRSRGGGKIDEEEEWE